MAVSLLLCTHLKISAKSARLVTIRTIKMKIFTTIWAFLLFRYLFFCSEIQFNLKSGKVYAKQCSIYITIKCYNVYFLVTGEYFREIEPCK